MTLIGQSLLNTEALLTSRNPIIRKVGHRFQRYVLEVDDDGNCYGTSWVLSVLLWAVQSPSRLKAFLGELEDASRDSGAFVDLNYAVKVRWVFSRAGPKTTVVFVTLNVSFFSGSEELSQEETACLSLSTAGFSAARGGSRKKRRPDFTVRLRFRGVTGSGLVYPSSPKIHVQVSSFKGGTEPNLGSETRVTIL